MPPIPLVLTFYEMSCIIISEWQCPECGTNHDRDLNAALNILTFGRAGAAQNYACGEGSSVDSKLSPSAKQEAPR